MAIVQETFDIPADIMTKLLTGEYRINLGRKILIYQLI